MPSSMLLILFSLIIGAHGFDIESESQPSSTGTQESLSANYLEGLDGEDTPEEEMEDLIGRLSTFRERAEKVQTSKSEEAINARFFQGLDDDEDEDEGSSLDAQIGSALMELLTTGKMPASLKNLLVKVETMEQVDPTGGDVSLESPVPKKVVREVDPPTIIKTYHDLHPSESDSESEKPSPAEHSNPIVSLNRFNFHNNVMSNRNDEVEHWIIRFCHDWYSPCERMLPAYKELALKSEQKLNQVSLKTIVRFAEIDCSTDKPLCNDQGAEMFPMLIHYHHGAKVSSWLAEYGGDENDEVEMKKWMQGESQKIMKSRSWGHKDAMKSGVGLVNLQSGLVWSCASMVVSMLAHVWLVRFNKQSDESAGGTEDSSNDDKTFVKKAVVLGPSGLASMLPEEWVSKASEEQLLDL